MLLLQSGLLTAQTLSGISTRWADSFAAWEIFGMDETDSTSTDEIKIGELSQRWINTKDDWTEWDFKLYHLEGTIKLKWKNDPSMWELRTYTGQIVTMKRLWMNDNSEWRVTEGDVQAVFRSKYTTQPDQWEMRDDTYGRFTMKTYTQSDPRDWVIYDELKPEVTDAMRMAMIFLTVSNSSPRR